MNAPFSSKIIFTYSNLKPNFNTTSTYINSNTYAPPLGMSRRRRRGAFTRTHVSSEYVPTEVCMEKEKTPLLRDKKTRRGKIDMKYRERGRRREF
jgi:hypothetical protein